MGRLYRPRCEYLWKASLNVIREAIGREYRAWSYEEPHWARVSNGERIRVLKVEALQNANNAEPSRYQFLLCLCFLSIAKVWHILMLVPLAFQIFLISQVLYPKSSYEFHVQCIC